MICSKEVQNNMLRMPRLLFIAFIVLFTVYLWFLLKYLHSFFQFGPLYFLVSRATISRKQSQLARFVQLWDFTRRSLVERPWSGVYPSAVIGTQITISALSPLAPNGNLFIITSPAPHNAQVDARSAQTPAIAISAHPDNIWRSKKPAFLNVQPDSMALLLRMGWSVKVWKGREERIRS